MILAKALLLVSLLFGSGQQTGPTLPNSIIVPIHVHKLVPISQAALDKQLDVMNETFAKNTLFRFRLASVDEKQERIGGKTDLNVWVEDDVFHAVVGNLAMSSLPWEIKDAETLAMDGIRISVLGMPLQGGSIKDGYCLTHEAGHWLGLLHDRPLQQIGLKDPNCMAYSFFTRGCVFSEAQAYHMEFFWRTIRE